MLSFVCALFLVRGSQGLILGVLDGVHFKVAGKLSDIYRDLSDDLKNYLKHLEGLIAKEIGCDSMEEFDYRFSFMKTKKKSNLQNIHTDFLPFHMKGENDLYNIIISLSDSGSHIQVWPKLKKPVDEKIMGTIFHPPW